VNPGVGNFHFPRVGRFGFPLTGKLTPEQERRLIEAALAAYDGRRRRRFPRSETGSETGSEF